MTPDLPFILSLLAGVAIDRWLGEPRRWHPLVGFGRLADGIERGLRRGVPGHALGNRLRGLLGWLLLVLPPVLLAACWRHPILDALLLGFALGGRSLIEHARPIGQALLDGRLEEARRAVARIVSRDCDQLDETAVAGAGVESVLENGHDAVFATLFWFCVAGGAGALLYRLANTLDAMWGYRDARRRYFGWAAARLDDLLGWLPARLTAITYALLGNPQHAWRCWREQAGRWQSPNAGPVMAAGAGSLGVRLGGAARYHGVREHRPELGCRRPARAADIERALSLVNGGVLLWLGLSLVWAVLWRLLHA
ncbi:Cobalamin biosynthesis protein CobD [Sterolibacterium denitrificans]|uniref:Cobalamin biosynthesis protein CobD n=1 Tax=Sterolibacterium denitrificans TaxID=157592 RepID=A0A7Z7HNE2_9PROT|nr:adenosylcobinamide-phosphate synthase CbiB [Sterolibacterium denitrificans]SMB21062.1 Cobalamin biosynthesis protein CobD [Sterolibacterium denitrificans]